MAQTKKYMLEHFDRTARERDRLDMMLHDVMNGLVTYGEWFKELDGAGRYRVGISRATNYPLAIATWRMHGQSDSITVFDAEPWEADLRRMRASSETWEPILRALLSAKEAMKSAEVAA